LDWDFKFGACSVMSYALLVLLQEEVVDEAADDRPPKRMFLLAK
jgi:hypothetical protein